MIKRFASTVKCTIRIASSSSIPVLYKTVNVTAGLKEGGLILLNSTHSSRSYPFPGRFRSRDGGCQRHCFQAQARVAHRADREHGHPRGVCQSNRVDRDRSPGRDHPGIDSGKRKGKRGRGPGSVRKREDQVRNMGRERRFHGSLKKFSPQRTQRTQRKLKWIEKQKRLKLG